jgi:hypothetical protein
MSKEVMPEAGNRSQQARGRGFWPRSGLGWTAIILALVALAAWVVFPVITTAYREKYPLVDTWVMPAIATVLVDAAAILSLAAVWRRRDRSVLNIIILVVTMLAGLFFTAMVVGEGITGPAA